MMLLITRNLFQPDLLTFVRAELWSRSLDRLPTTVANITFTVHDGCCSTSAGSIKLSIDTDITIIIPSPTATYNFYFDSLLATESHTMPRVLECPARWQISTGRILLRRRPGSWFLDIPFKKRDPNPVPLYFNMQSRKKMTLIHQSQKTKGDQAEVCVCFWATFDARQCFISPV